MVERYLPYEELISKHWPEIVNALELGPCNDLACGDCRYGIVLAGYDPTAPVWKTKKSFLLTETWRT